MKTLSIIIAIIILITAGTLIYSIKSPQGVWKIEHASFLILSLTLAVLIWYAYSTHTIATVTRSKWEKETPVHLATYSMVMADTKNRSDRVLFRMNNPSTLFIKAKIRCNFRVYGDRVDDKDAYNGKETWYIFPQQESQGWFELTPLLAKKGKALQDMVNEKTPENRESQLTMDLEIDFEDELRNTRNLPARRHFFDFKAWTWIPHLTVREDQNA